MKPNTHPNFKLNGLKGVIMSLCTSDDSYSYINFESGNGLSFQQTQNLLIDSNENVEQISVNMSRNCQQIEEQSGAKICAMISEEVDQQVEEEKQRIASIPQKEHFFMMSEDNSSHLQIWDAFLAEVGKVGKVLFACHVGSKCYNLQVPTSDADMIAIVAMPTEKMLAFELPKLIIKNQEGFQPDFTIHEVASFVDLLIHGDPRMMETLYQHEESVVFESPEWSQLKEHRNQFLTKAVVKKYLGELNGVKGFKKLNNIQAAITAGTETVSRLWKHFYIILRVLHLALKILQSESFHLWMDNDSEERKFLLDVRAGKYDFDYLLNLSQEKKQIIEQLLASSDSIPENCDDNIVREIDQWLLEIRHKNFQDPPIIHGDNSSVSGLEADGIIAQEQSEIIETISNLVPGKLIFLAPVHSLQSLTPLSQHQLIGVYVCNSDQLLSESNKPESTIMKDNVTIYEMGRFIDLLLQANPNIAYFLFIADNLVYYESNEWKNLRHIRDIFFSSKLVHQTMGFLKGNLRAFQNPKKKPDIKQIERVFPAVFLLERAFTIHSSVMPKEDIYMFSADQLLDYARHIHQLAEQEILDELPTFPKQINMNMIDQLLRDTRKQRFYTIKNS